MNLDSERKLIERLRGDLKALRFSLSSERERLEQAKTVLAHTQTAREVLQAITQAVQQKAHRRISSVVTSCLRAVFGEEAYIFKIQFDKKRGKTEARLRFLRDGLDADPLTACGGGMVDVAAFALRIACLSLHRPRLSRVLVLDEPFRFVSATYQDNVRTMLEKLAKDLHLQIIFITHNPALATGKIIEL